MKNLLSDTKEQIKKVLPHTKEVDIKVQRDVDGQIITKIHVRAKNKILHAVKKDSTLNKSLDKTYQAIAHQISRIKERTKRIRRKRLLE